MGIKYLKRWEIDTIKWDRCVLSSTHSLSYALSGYLDGVCDSISDYSKFNFDDDNQNTSEILGQWDALVLNDYEAVFPLPWRKKFGLHYIFQPLFCQQLGLFGNPGAFSIDDFIRKIPVKFIKIHLQIHPFFGKPKGASLKTNFILDCPHVPNEKFNKDALKNIKKCQETELFFRTPPQVSDVLSLYNDTWGYKAKLKWFDDYEGFETACINMIREEKLFTTLVKDNEGNKLGAAIFLISPKRIHYVCAAPTEMGKKLGIMHCIIAHTAEKFPEHEIDFEGSSIPSVAEFYKKFNPLNEPFYIIQRNLLTNL